MNTRKRPGIVTCEVSLAPFVPSGSLTTWTRTSCPSLSRSSILATGFFARPAPVRVGAGCDADRLVDGFLFVFVARLEALEFLDRVDDFGDVEERVALEADVNEGGLHAGEDFGDPALVDVSDDAPVAFPLDENLD